MAIDERSGELIAAAPVSKPAKWRELGMVLYSWADRRDPAVDRNWWITQRPRIYEPLRDQASMEAAPGALEEAPASSTAGAIDALEEALSASEDAAYAPMEEAPGDHEEMLAA